MSDGQSADGAGHFGRKLEREFERGDRLADQPRVVGKLIFDEAAREPHQARIHPVGVEEGPRHVEQADDALRRAQAAGRADFAARIEPDRHRDLDRVGVDAADVVAEHHQHLVEGGEAELLIALPPLLRFGANEAGAFEDLQVGRDGRLRQVERLGDVVDVDAGAPVQQPQDSRPRAGEASPRSTSGRSSGSMTRKLRDILRPAQSLRRFVSAFRIF